MELGQRVIKGLKTGATLRLAAQVFTWLKHPDLIRLLTPDDYGLMAMAMAFIGILALMGDFGVAKALIQNRGVDGSSSQPGVHSEYPVLHCIVSAVLQHSTSDRCVLFRTQSHSPGFRSWPCSI